MTAPAMDLASTGSAASFSFTVPRSALAEALSRVKLVARGNLPILQTVLMEADRGTVRLTATDIDQWIVTTLPGVVVAGNGRAAIPLARLTDVINGMAAGTPVSITITGRKAKVSGGRAKFDLVCLDPSDWPEPRRESVGETLGGTIDGRALTLALDRAKAHASKEEVTTVFGGVLIEGTAEGLFVVATDRHSLFRMHIAERAPFQGEFIVTPIAASMIVKLFANDESVSLEGGENELRIAGATTSMTTRLVGGPYPPYRQAIGVQAPAFTTIADRQELTRAIRAATAVATDDVCRVLVQFRAQAIDLRAEYTDAGSAADQVSAARTVLVRSTQFTNYWAGQAWLMLRTLDSLACPEIVIAYNGAERPIVLRDASKPDALTFALILPLRVVPGTDTLVDEVETAEASDA